MTESIHSPERGAVDVLAQCRGRPVRLSLFDPIYRERVGRYSGMLTDVTEDYLELELVDLNEPAAPGTLATLELTRDGQVFWCHSALALAQPAASYAVRLVWPHAVQTVQRRGAPRVEVNVPLHYVTEGSNLPGEAVMTDISKGGAAIAGKGSVAPGDSISLVFALGSGLFFQDIKARILRVSYGRSGQWTAGLQFVALTAEQERLLADWIRRQYALQSNRSK